MKDKTRFYRKTNNQEGLRRLNSAGGYDGMTGGQALIANLKALNEKHDGEQDFSPVRAQIVSALVGLENKDPK